MPPQTHLLLLGSPPQLSWALGTPAPPGERTESLCHGAQHVLSSSLPPVVDTSGVSCSMVRTQPFRNCAFKGSRATLVRKLSSLSLSSGVHIPVGRLLSHPKTGCLCVCPQNAFLLFRAPHSQILGEEHGTKEIQTRGLSYPHSDRFKYKHNVYHISSAMSFRVFKRLIVSPAERFV